MSRITTRTILAAAVATSGTFTVAFPVGYTAGHFKVGKRHRMVALQRLMEAPKDFTVAFTTLATITYLGATTIPAGTEVFVELDSIDMGEPDFTSRRAITTSRIGQQRALFENVVAFHLGSPAAASTTSLRASAAHAGGAMTLIAAGQTFDVPRAIQITSAGNDSATIFTVVGTDEYGATLTENVTGPNATSVTGLKAFKTITSVTTPGATVGAVSLGTGTKLGLPVFVPGAGNILREILDSAVATAGTLVAGVVTTPSAVTGDVRGTYIPNSLPDGLRTYQLVAYLEEPTYLGAPQF